MLLINYFPPLCCSSCCTELLLNPCPYHFVGEREKLLTAVCLSLVCNIGRLLRLSLQLCKLQSLFTLYQMLIFNFTPFSFLTQFPFSLPPTVTLSSVFLSLSAVHRIRSLWIRPLNLFHNGQSTAQGNPLVF